MMIFWKREVVKALKENVTSDIITNLVAYLASS